MQAKLRTSGSEKVWKTPTPKKVGYSRRKLGVIKDCSTGKLPSYVHVMRSLKLCAYICNAMWLCELGTRHWLRRTSRFCRTSPNLPPTCSLCWIDLITIDADIWRLSNNPWTLTPCGNVRSKNRLHDLRWNVGSSLNRSIVVLLSLCLTRTRRISILCPIVWRRAGGGN
jgi:hypothetical protein